MQRDHEHSQRTERFMVSRVTLAPTDPEAMLASPQVHLEERPRRLGAVFRVAGTATRRPSVPVPAECTARRGFLASETRSWRKTSPRKNLPLSIPVSCFGYAHYVVYRSSLYRFRFLEFVGHYYGIWESDFSIVANILFYLFYYKR